MTCDLCEAAREHREDGAPVESLSPVQRRMVLAQIHGLMVDSPVRRAIDYLPPRTVKPFDERSIVERAVHEFCYAD